MLKGYLIKGGSVVDGTGAAPFRSDVRIRGGLITEVAGNIAPEPRERVIDAAGCYVSPGFFESHNHFDGVMWWQPTMDPMPGYGVTTSVNGNCGFSAAPVHEDPAVRKELVGIFSFFEDIPEKPFLDILPWDWRLWSEYRASLEKHVKLPINYATYVGHIAIRLAVMGMEAWDRAATPEEIALMCKHLDDALGAGALGMSSNLLDMDSRGRLVPSQMADDAEMGALMDVIARYPGRQMQVIVDIFFHFTGPKSVARIGRLAGERGVRLQIAGGIPTLDFQAFLLPAAQEAVAKLRAEGVDVWMGFHHLSPTVVVNFTSTLAFGQSNMLVWHDIIRAQTDAEKFALLSNPEWRNRARASWDEGFEQSPIKNPEKLTLLESETRIGPVGITLAEFMRQRKIAHPSDGLAEWLLDNGMDSLVKPDGWPSNEELLLELFRDKMTLGNLADSGAHGKLFCGVGDNVLLLTKYVRDLKQLSIGEAVHVMTGKAAQHFGMSDRGVIAVGKRADITVFNLDEIECRAQVKAYDVPDGEGGTTYRYTRAPAPMRLTMVNGVPTFDEGAFTGKFPGQYITTVAAELPESIAAREVEHA